jgi:hypothetical protein
MSISGIQRRRLFEEVTRSFYASGEKPRLSDILTEVSRYFSKYPPGTPLKPLQGFASDGQRSNVDYMNAALFGMQHNLSVAYEAALEQIRDIMMTTSVLQSSLERLRLRRRALMSQIDDYLFTLFNADGYFMALSDTFDNLENIDLSLTTALVDTAAGKVTIPANSHLTRPVPINQIGNNINLTASINGSRAQYKVLSPFENALDGLDNTIWGVEVESNTQAEVIVVFTVPVGTQDTPAYISRIEFDPWGVEPVQTMVRTYDTRLSTTKDLSAGEPEGRTISQRTISIPPEFNDASLAAMGFKGDDFDNKIVTSASKMVFADNLRKSTHVSFFLRKNTPDYSIRTASGTTVYRYIFGAKDIVFTQHVYDQEAILVSKALSLPTEVDGEHVIDAVSLLANATVPTDTSITYWVAADIDSADPGIGDFEWKKIKPIEKVDRSPDSIVRFGGARTSVVSITSSPQNGELQLILPQNAEGTEPSQLNPNPNIIQGTDIWRLAEFSDDIIPSSAVLEEGVNTARILHVASSSTADNDLTFWTDYISGASTASEIYMRIDEGKGILDGSVIGESDRYVYVETYLETGAATELFIRNFRKADANAKDWDVKVYLNGREIGVLDVGTDFLAIPWKFVEGLNHIVLLVTIPEATDDVPQVYDGKLLLMEDSNLDDFGTVKLATWTYVDFFHMQYNEVNTPFSFTIREVGENKKEIISRRQPTDNFRFKYAKSTNAGPSAIRVKADLQRSVENPHVTPSLDLYRVRFLYAQ